MTGRKRGKIQELKERTDVVENLRTRKTELFDQITRKLFDNVNTIYENLLPNASLNFSEGNENPPHLGANRYESRHSWLCSLRDEYSNTSRYRAAMAIMLCVNEVTEAPGLIVSDFRTFFSDIDLFEFLRYIFGWTKQRLIVLSKTHVVAAGADRFFWLYRTHLVCIFSAKNCFRNVHILIPRRHGLLSCFTFTERMRRFRPKCETSIKAIAFRNRH